MAIIDNTLAAQVPTFDPATPLAQAAKLQAADTEIRQQQFKQAQFEIGSEARGLAAVQNSPEFPKLWAEAADRMAQKGLLSPQAHAQWRNTPSPLLLKQMIAQTEDPTLSFNKDEAVRDQSNRDRLYGLKKRELDLMAEGSKVPANFQRGTDGSLVPVKGGPADPEYVRSLNEAKEKPRNMSISDITKLSEEGGKFAQVGGFLDTFDPEFAGRPLGLGEARNWVGRTLPSSIVDPKAAEGATWWQGYDKFKNVVRNDLFGSALTTTEKAAFEKADINPGMNPTQVTENLKTQKDIYEKGIVRKASAMIEAGYKPEAIAKAYGVSLESLGVKPKSGKGGSNNDAALQRARDAIAKGAPKDAVVKRLQDAGIDASGL